MLTCSYHGNNSHYITLEINQSMWFQLSPLKIFTKEIQQSVCNWVNGFSIWRNFEPLAATQHDLV